MIGTQDITCQISDHDQTQYVFGASGGYVKNDVLICGGNKTKLCRSIFGPHLLQPVTMKYMRQDSSSIVFRDQVST